MVKNVIEGSSGTVTVKRIGTIGVIVLITTIASWQMMNKQPVSVILDSDLSSDVDDVGAVAVLHSLANQGLANILGMAISSGDRWSAGCLQALNTFLGRPEIPVGIVSGKVVIDKSKYTRIISEEFLEKSSDRNSIVEDATSLYRRLLSSQPDGSVVLVTIGYLTNLKNLLESSPDDNSSLSGTELVEKKVKKLVTMGGQYPEGREWNFYRDSAAASFVVKQWPTPILFCGFESGSSVKTGSILQQTPASNPVRRSYELYNTISDRSSWDQLTVLYAVTGKKSSLNPSGYFQAIEGINEIAADGSNRWKKVAAGLHAYTRSQKSDAQLKQIIEEHMVQAIEKTERQR